MRGGRDARRSRSSRPQRVLETPGWISADLHVHAAPSDDSALPLAARVATYVAEGAEVLVATDHDVVTDYGPLIRELGLASADRERRRARKSRAASRRPRRRYTFGHANAFPLPRRPTEYRAGAIRNEGRRLREVIDRRARARRRPHRPAQPPARSGGDAQGFFEHLSVGHGFEPDAAARASAQRRAARARSGDRHARPRLRRDGAAERPVDGALPALRDDWFALLRQGVVRTATANSDSHLARRGRRRAAQPGPRRRRRPRALRRGRASSRAIRAGRVVGTTGPILDVHVGDAGIGETHRGREGAIRIDVHAAPWVPVATRARLRERRARARDRRVAGRDGLVPAHASTRDAFVTVEVEGGRPTRPTPRGCRASPRSRSPTRSSSTPTATASGRRTGSLTPS